MRNIDEIEGLIKDIKARLIELFGRGIKEVILYGSFARGEAEENSDIDLAVIVDDDLETGDVEREISEYLFDILLEQEELVSVVAISEKTYKNYKMPVINAVKKEGKTI